MILAWDNLLGPVGGLLAADDDGGIINILVVVAMVIFGLVGHFIKKAQEKQQVEEANRKVEEAKLHHAQMVTSGRLKADSAFPVAVPPLRPTTAAQRVAAVLQAQAAMAAKPPPPPRAAKPRPVHAQFDLAEGVREEVRKVHRHLSTEQADRSHRLEHTEVLKSDIGPKSPPAEAPAEEKPKIRLNLSSPKAARTAIICAEVLGLPKALRSDPEPWER